MHMKPTRPASRHHYRTDVLCGGKDTPPLDKPKPAWLRGRGFRQGAPTGALVRHGWHMAGEALLDLARLTAWRMPGQTISLHSLREG